MKNYFFAMSLGLGGFLWAADSVNAQQPTCAKREMVIERLHNKFGETRQSIGLGRNNSVVEVFASTDTGTWTIVVTMPNGVSCLVASGESFEQLAEDVPPLGHDA